MARVETTDELGLPLNIFIDNAADFTAVPAGPCSIEVYGVGGEDVRLFPSEQAFRAAVTGMEPIAMIPIGTFPAEEGDDLFVQSPHILFAGLVRGVEWNPAAREDEPNCALLVETLELLFQLHLRYEGEVEPGYFVHGVAWLFGDLELSACSKRLN